MNGKTYRWGAEESKESCVDEREEEHIMGQIDEIGGVADKRWEASACSGKDSGGQTEHSNGSDKTEAEHKGWKDWGVVS